jgi:hypothetical protein
MDPTKDTPSDTIPAPPVIERGHAREAVLVALANVARAVGELEAVAAAVARALDEQAPRQEEPRCFHPILALLIGTAVHHAAVVGFLS